jgi:hypothetical protein
LLYLRLRRTVVIVIVAVNVEVAGVEAGLKVVIGIEKGGWSGCT